MSSRALRRVDAALTLSLLVVLVLAAAVARAQSITEFPVPSPPATGGSIGADLHAITVGPDNALWFNESGVQKIGRITTQGVLTEFPTPDATFGIATGPDGNLWFTTYGGIGRMTTSGAVTVFPVPASFDPSEFAPFDIVRGPDDAMWFSVEQGYIGRVTMSGSMTVFSVPSILTADGGLFGLAFGPDGNVWYGGLRSGVLGRMSPTGDITEFPGWGPLQLKLGPDGALWGSGLTNLGRISAPSGAVQTFPVTTTGSLAAGPDGNLWLALSKTSIGRVTVSGTVTEIPVPTIVHNGRGDGSFPYGFVAGPDGNIWFTEEYGGKIGRVNLQPAPTLCTPDSHTLCLDGGRFSVTAMYQSTSAGASLDATAVSLTDATGYFWFFDQTNVELIVKVLNGCGVNGTYWVFAAGLTNVGVHLVVTDLSTGLQKAYDNAVGTPFPPIQDTSAFHACP